MNARPFIKSARALIVASGLIAASTTVASAQDVPIALGAQATIALGNYYIAPPSGVTTLGDATLGFHTFDLTAGTLIQLANNQSVAFAGSYPNTTTVYLLVNTFNTYLYYDQMPVGTVVLTFSDGTTQTTTLSAGINVREWRIGAGGTVNTVQAGTGSTQAWTGTAQPWMGGGTAVIDMLAIPVTGAPKTLTAVALNDTNTWGNLRIDLAGLTIEEQNPNPNCIRPGQSCSTPAAQNSQAWKWQPVLPGATNTNPHSH